MNSLYTFFCGFGFFKNLHNVGASLASPCVPNLAHVARGWEHLAEDVEALLGVVPGKLLHGLWVARLRHGSEETVHVLLTLGAAKVLAEGLGHEVVLEEVVVYLVKLLGGVGILAQEGGLRDWVDPVSGDHLLPELLDSERLGADERHL